MKIKIRKARTPDLKRIAELQKQQNLLHQKFDNKFYTPNKDYKNKWIEAAKNKLSDKRHILLVAVDGNVIIGFILGDIRERPFREVKKYGSIEEIFVENNYRRQRVGTKLMDGLTKCFRAKELPYIEFGVNSKNKNALEFYEELGFKEYEKTLKKDI